MSELKPCPNCGRDENHHMVWDCKNYMGADGEWFVYKDPEYVTRKPEIGDWYILNYDLYPGSLEQISGYEDLMAVGMNREDYYVWATREEATAYLGSEEDY